MAALIFSLLSFGIVLFVITYFQRRNKVDEPEILIREDEECCGAHAVCERDTLLSSENVIVYYDDEDLDELAAIPSQNYTKTQVAQFSEVFYTLREEDVSGWLRSLQLRGIELPASLRDEALLVVAERRSN